MKRYSSAEAQARIEALTSELKDTKRDNAYMRKLLNKTLAQLDQEQKERIEALEDLVNVGHLLRGNTDNNELAVMWDDAAEKAARAAAGAETFVCVTASGAAANEISK